MEHFGLYRSGFHHERTAKMFHVKHLCVPFAVKCCAPRREIFHPCAGRPKGGVREVVEEHKTFNFFRTLKPHKVSSSPTVLTGHLGLDFPFYKDAGCALVFAAEGESIGF
jgi:hypothetical protein